eukprot:sb/3466203/
MPLHSSGFSYDPQELMDNDIFYYNFNIQDYSVPLQRTLLDICKVVSFAQTEGGVAIHCHAGLGRTGVVIACFLIYHHKMKPKDVSLLLTGFELLWLPSDSAGPKEQAPIYTNTKAVFKFALYLAPLWHHFPVSRQNIKTVINLQENGEHASCGMPLHSSGFSYDPQELMDNDIFYYNFNIQDYSVPLQRTLLDICKVVSFAQTEGGVAIHCHAGLGRTGVVIACFLIYHHKMKPKDAILLVRKNRPRSIQTRNQLKAVFKFALYLAPLWHHFPVSRFVYSCPIQTGHIVTIATTQFISPLYGCFCSRYNLFISRLHSIRPHTGYMGNRGVHQPCAAHYIDNGNYGDGDTN